MKHHVLFSSTDKRKTVSSAAIFLGSLKVKELFTTERGKFKLKILFDYFQVFCENFRITKLNFLLRR